MAGDGFCNEELFVMENRLPNSGYRSSVKQTPFIRERSLSFGLKEFRIEAHMQYDCLADCAGSTAKFRVTCADSVKFVTFYSTPSGWLAEPARTARNFHNMDSTVWIPFLPVNRKASSALFLKALNDLLSNPKRKGVLLLAFVGLVHVH